MTDLSTELRQLEELTRADLIKRWIEAFDCPIPKHMSLPMMRRILGFELQSERQGGLSPTTRRRISGVLGSASRSAVQAQAPGSRLIREWNGVTHTVLVQEDGFEWQGRTYRSLSAIAREITGAHWSGPRFFQTNRRSANG